MSGPPAAKLALARAVGALSRLRGGGATSAPGKALLRLEPGAIAELGARLERGSVVVSATNGKTTTAALAAAILTQDGTLLVHNRAGANMAGGIASTLLQAARPRGGIAGELGLFEVDEFWLGRLVKELRPRVIVLGNLFRDQLDRYGELDAIAERWEQTVHAGAGAAARLVCNADDPVLADIGRERAGASHDTAPPSAPGPGASAYALPDASTDAPPGTGSGPDVLYFGVEDDSLALGGMAHAADAKHCRNCGAPYVFDAVYLGHLGHYHCEACGRARPEPAVSARDVRLEGVRAARFTLHTPAGKAEVALALPGLYNVYNAVAAAALATALEVPLEQIVAGLQSTKAAFGRAESVMLATPPARRSARLAQSDSLWQSDPTQQNHAHPSTAPRELRILLIKNPAGANEVLRTLALEEGEHDVLGVLNDGVADGRDVSWVWDADFEQLAGRVRRATCSGTRAAELAVRLKYAGVERERIRVQPDLAKALDEASADRPATTAPATPTALDAAPEQPGAPATTDAASAPATPTAPDAAPEQPGAPAASDAAGDADALSPPPPLYALPTYTAMLELRELLAARRGGGRGRRRSGSALR
jgi:UDP-N-acetylmuramyl tripeptide synthase